MPLDLIPRAFFNSAPSRLSSFLDDEDWSSLQAPPSGLSVSEDDKAVYVEASLPGIDPDKTEVTLDKGVIWIRGSSEEEEEKKERKYYRKSSSSFSYRVAVPGEVDTNTEPDVSHKNGVIHVTFKKFPVAQPKKLTIRKE